MPTTRTILTEVHYSEIVRPERCQKDYWRENAINVDFTLDAYTDDEAPVALIVRRYGAKGDKETPYRLVNGKLYRAMESVPPVPQGVCFKFDVKHHRRPSFMILEPVDSLGFEPEPITKDLPCAGVFHWPRPWPPEKAKVLEILEEEQAACILIDDILWKESLEPAYYRIGAKWWHIDVGGSTDGDKYEWNATELEEVLQGSQVPEDVEIEYQERIEVLIPEAVALPTNREKREVEHMVRAMEHLNSAGEELEKVSSLDSEIAFNEAGEVKARLMRKLEELEVRKQRGCGSLPDGQLAKNVEDAYNSLLRLID